MWCRKKRRPDLQTLPSTTRIEDGIVVLRIEVADLRTPIDEQNRGTGRIISATTKGTNPVPRSPSHDATVNLPAQTRRVSPPYDVTGPPLQHRRVSLTSQRPPLNVEIRTPPALQHGTSPSSRYAPNLNVTPVSGAILETSEQCRQASPGSSYLQQRYRPRTPPKISLSHPGQRVWKSITSSLNPAKQSKSMP